MSLFDNEHNSSIQEAINGNQSSVLQAAISVTAPAATEIAAKTIELKTAVEYYFDVISEHSIEMINQITDNYVENNTAIQDHIAQNPLVISISGISGEKVFRYDPTVANQLLAEARLQAAKMGNSINFNNLQAESFWDLVGLGSYAKDLNKLSAIPVLYPPVSNYVQVAKNAVELVDAAVSKYRNIYDSIFNKEKGSSTEVLGENILTETRLKEIYNNLAQLRANNIALVVSTPYGIFPDMYIQSVRLRQGNELYVTDIEMSLKQLRFSNVTTTAADKDVMAKYNAYARAEVENNGIAQGINEDVSIIYKTVANNRNAIQLNKKGK